ncbi:ATP-binding protein [Rhizobium leguminosarum]|uniref:ATP-binding protein n=1 Tax=Rhizobium leguminosarum TaxID=384 RepID=UPI00144284BD|nr:ATP-binding protein [Rhizobium leguminosarum]MBY5841270.1 ATP-binding protein [Rhizobium leguminosarum]NKM80971.1 ATP-binding protein [Rhizobium leguminosarum bv. viciae]QSZ07254.1 ATP-binding protein [Rhizobium leguminosarum]
MTTNHETIDDDAFIPADLAIQAMRDSGYKNTAYALAELVDNSVQAEAKSIEIFCIEEQVQVVERIRRRLNKIAVLDNGDGMDATVLRKALQFGNGTRLNARSGIGRFGMGLPNASISQALRLDVWSWQNGPENSLHTYLDVNEIRGRLRTKVPPPEARPVPEEWRRRAAHIGKTGTLVVWTSLSADKLTWKGAKATLKNTGWLLGRIHRRFIGSGKLEIRLIGGEDGNLQTESVTINDPMYLTPAPTMVAPFNTEAMFEFLYEDPITVEKDGEHYQVMTRYSVAKPKTKDLAGDSDRGHTAYGQDAANNIGVSVMREGRELMLDRSWTIQYDPRDRWWGCEVEFPAALDEIFGVTNNKQAATVFNELSSLDWTDLAEGKETKDEVEARLKEEGDPKGVLLHLSKTIKDNLRQIRNTIKDQGKKRGSPAGDEKRHDDGDPTEEANKRWKQRDETNPIPDGPTQPSSSDIDELKEDLTEDGRRPEESTEIVARIVSGDLKVVFVDKALGGSGELFTVVPRGPATEVVFNRRHPAFDMIFNTVSSDDDLGALGTPELQDRLLHATKAVQLLFAAWARMEREDPEHLSRYERVRENWGKLARDFLEPVDLADFE